MPIITSRTNPKIKFVRSLRQRKVRRAAGLLAVEGIRHVGEAVEAGVAIQGLYFAPELLTSEFARTLVEGQKQAGIPCYEVTAEVFEWLAEKENPQGILAVVSQPCHHLDDLMPGNFPWGLAVVAPQDPGNVGAVLRTVDAVGASGLLLLEGGSDPYAPNAVRASMGTIFWRPVVEAAFDEFRRWAALHKYLVYGTSAHADLDYQQVPRFTKPCILLMGSEREGLTDEQVAACDVVLRIPMFGRATSLNLAVAAGILLYKMLESFG